MSGSSNSENEIKDEHCNIAVPPTWECNDWLTGPLFLDLDAFMPILAPFNQSGIDEEPYRRNGPTGRDSQIGMRISTAVQNKS